MSLLSCLLVPAALLLIISAPLDARPPDVSHLESWARIHNKSICRASVAYDKNLGIHQVWCDDGVEGLVFEAIGGLFVCRTVRFSVPFHDSDVDVAAGCVAVGEGSQPDPWMAIDVEA